MVHDCFVADESASPVGLVFLHALRCAIGTGKRDTISRIRSEARGRRPIAVSTATGAPHPPRDSSPVCCLPPPPVCVVLIGSGWNSRRVADGIVDEGSNTNTPDDQAEPDRIGK